MPGRKQAFDRWLARGLRSGPLELWDTSTWERVHSWQGHAADVYTETISFNADGTLLAAPAGREVIIWNVGSGERLHVLAGHTGDQCLLQGSSTLERG